MGNTIDGADGIEQRLASAKPAMKDYRISIGGNAYLDVLATGNKVWRLRYQNPQTRKPAIYTIGGYPAITYLQALSVIHAVKQMIKRGVEPAKHKHQLQAVSVQLDQQAKHTDFESVARAWHQHRHQTLKRWKDAHAVSILLSLERDVFPIVGRLPIGDVTAPLLLDVVRRVIERDAVETAHKIAQRLNAIFRYAVVRKLVQFNEADHLRGELPTPQQTANPYLIAEAMPEFLQALHQAEDLGELAKAALRLTLYTLARTGEIRAAEWSEIDLEAATWKIPAHRMKMGKAHSVPLPRQAVELLRGLQAITGEGRYLFSINSKPLGKNIMLNALYRLGYRQRLTVHGIRATASTILNESGYRGEVIEAALAHQEKNAIRAKYNHAIYWEERREMLQAYADRLEAWATPAAIVS